MPGNFRKLRSGNGARSIWLGEDGFAGERKEDACNFIHRLVAQCSKNDDELSCAEIFLKEDRQFACRRRIVRAIKVDIWTGVHFFDATGPDCGCDSLLDGVDGDVKSPRLQDKSGRDCIQSGVQLKAASQLRVQV